VLTDARLSCSAVMAVDTEFTEGSEVSISALALALALGRQKIRVSAIMIMTSQDILAVLMGNEPDGCDCWSILRFRVLFSLPSLFICERRLETSCCLECVGWHTV
jgi:hypothetical protein